MVQWANKYLYPSLETLGTSSTINTIVESEIREAQKWLTEVKEEADQNGILLKIEFISDRESVVGAIVDYAEQQKNDIIVLGSRGLSGFKKLMLGSTASGVVSYAHCPVLVVK